MMGKHCGDGMMSKRLRRPHDDAHPDLVADCHRQCRPGRLPGRDRIIIEPPAIVSPAYKEAVATAPPGWTSRSSSRRYSEGRLVDVVQ